MVKPEVDRLIKPLQVRRLVRVQYFDTKPEDVNSAIRNLMIGVYRWFSDLCDVAGRDPMVRRAYAMRRNAISSRRVDVKPGTRDEPERAQFIADAVRKMVEGIDGFEQLTNQMLDGLGKGIACCEINWVFRDGLWVPTFSLVRTRDLEWDPDGGVGIRPLNGPYIRVADHPGKFWVFIPSTQTGLPTDQGDFIAVLYFWLFKRWGYKFWLQGAERFGNPFVFARLPGVADVSVRQSMLQNLQELTADSVGVFDGDAGIDVIDAKMPGSASVWSEMVTQFDRQIQIALVGSPDLFDAGKNGSLAAVETRNAVRLESSESEARQLWASFTRDVVQRFLEYNADALGGWSDAPIVETVFESPTETANIIAALPQGLKVTHNELRSSVGLAPLAEGGDDVLGPVASQAAPQQAEGAPPALDVIPGENVQQSAFNGAQVASMLEIVREVAAGTIERETGVEMLVAAFPIDRETAGRIVGPGVVEKAVEEAAPLPLAKGPARGTTGKSLATSGASGYLTRLARELGSPSATRLPSQQKRR